LVLKSADGPADLLATSTGTDTAPVSVEATVNALTAPHPAPTRTPTVTIGIVEDDALLRQAFVHLLGAVDGFEVIDAVDTLAGGQALLDLALPDGNGLDVICRARETASATKVIVITVFGDVRSVVRAIEEGADGYLLKDSDAAQISSAIRTVLDGGAPISPAVASRILARLRTDTAKPATPPAATVTPPLTLTNKETLVLVALAKGRSFKEVAAQHGISLHTVGDHVKAIYRKLSVNSRGEAVFKAVQVGLIRMEQ
jgi:DNA-binding NarL/FixJ family response regulator